MWRILVALVFCSCAPTVLQPSCRRRDDQSGARRSICKDEIVAVMQPHERELQQCVSALAASRPSYEISVTFAIAADGTTSDQKVNPRTLVGPVAEHCLIDVLKRVQFPPFMHGTIPVTFPLRL